MLPKVKKYLKKYFKKRREDPEYIKKKSIWRKVESALENGTLIKQPCFCGNKKSDAHHDDYSNPLDVIWLCRRHHLERHAMMKEREKDEEK